MKPIRKFFEVKAEDATLSENQLKGAASVLGNIDSYGDVMFPGCYGMALSGFLKDGFVAVGHEWDDLPVAMPKVAEERGNQLYTEATFHSTSTAQDARTVCRERLDNGLSVGLSVGFYCTRDGCMNFQDGAALIAYASANGFDMRLFDVPTITAHEDPLLGILKVERLIEYSIVPIPANRLAQAMSAKAAAIDFDTISTVRELEDLLRDAGATKAQALATVSRLKDSLRDAGGSEKPLAEPAALPPADTTNFATLAYRALEARSLVAGVTTR